MAEENLALCTGDKEYYLILSVLKSVTKCHQIRRYKTCNNSVL